MPVKSAGGQRAIFRQVCELIPSHLVPRLREAHVLLPQIEMARDTPNTPCSPIMEKVRLRFEAKLAVCIAVMGSALFTPPRNGLKQELSCHIVCLTDMSIQSRNGAIHIQQVKSALILAVTMWAMGGGAQEPAIVELAPKIVCAEPTFNFGEMESSTDVEHVFVLKNEGDLSLEIRQVRPSCGCTVASLSQNTIPPGGQTELTTRLSLRGRQGAQHKTISVESNDPNQPTLVLSLEGTAVEEIRVRPNQLFFGRITTDSIVTGAVEITVQSMNAVKITRTSSNTSNLTVTTESSPDGRLARVLIGTQPPLPRGMLRGNVHIETDHPKYPAMDVAVSAFVVGDITFAPEELSVLEAVGQPANRYILVQSETGKKFKITKVEVPLPSMTYDIRPVETGGYHVELGNLPATRDVEGKSIRIQTDLQDVPDIVIPFRFIPAPPHTQ